MVHNKHPKSEDLVIITVQSIRHLVPHIQDFYAQLHLYSNTNLI